MNSVIRSNIDDVRAEIMRLENADHFDAGAWTRVLSDLIAGGRDAALADARRRMETARLNQPCIIQTTFESHLVVVETAEA